MSRANEVAGTSSSRAGLQLLAPTGAALATVDWDYEPAVEGPAASPPPPAGRYLAAIRWHDDDCDPAQPLPADQVAGT